MLFNVFPCSGTHLRSQIVHWKKCICLEYISLYAIVKLEKLVYFLY